jgi:hypothetical protein
VTLKYLTASLLLRGEMFNPGLAPFQDFEQLVRMRNSLMHMKPSDSAARKGAAALAQRGLAQRIDPESQMEWVDRMETPQTAEWACSTARALIRAVWDMVPEAGDHFTMVRRIFRDDGWFD